MTSKRMEIFHKGKRYWAHKLRLTDGRFRWKFYSSHKWPFYHGHFTQVVYNLDEAYEKFIEWLPFKVSKP